MIVDGGYNLPEGTLVKSGDEKSEAKEEAPGSRPREGRGQGRGRGQGAGEKTEAKHEPRTSRPARSLKPRTEAPK